MIYLRHHAFKRDRSCQSGGGDCDPNSARLPVYRPEADVSGEDLVIRTPPVEDELRGADEVATYGELGQVRRPKNLDAVPRL